MVTKLINSPIGRPPIPPNIHAKWQRFVNLLVKIAGVSAGAIKRVFPTQLEVFIVSENAANLFQTNEKHKRGAGRYCDKVIAQRKPLLVVNAKGDSEWNYNPDLQLGMISYLGAPLQWPDGDVFGTLCVFDRKENHYAQEYRQLLTEFKAIIEGDLQYLVEGASVPSEGENALTENEQGIRFSFAGLPLPYLSLDNEGRFIEVNQSLMDALGYTREELLGHSFGEFMPQEFLMLFRRHFIDFKKCGHIRTEFDLLRKDNQRISVQLFGRIAYHPDGSFKQTHCVWLDVTDRKLAQEALEKSERKYRELVNEAATIILRWDVNGNVTFFNEYAQSFFGFREGEILGRNVVGTIVPATEFTGRDLAVLMEEICRDPVRFEYNENENVKRNGERVWIAWKNRPVCSQTGELMEIHSVGIDITARKKAEEALRESEALWRSIADNSPDHIITVDRNLIIQYVNHASPGLTKEQLLGTPLYQYVAKEKQAEIKAILQEVCKTREPQTYETQYAIPGGGIIYYESIAAPRILSEKVIGLTINARDITAHQRAEDALRRSEVLELLAGDASLKEILLALAVNVEKRNPDSLCSVLLLDEDGLHLRFGAAPSLPDFFKNAIDGITVGYGVCSCGDAAFTGQRVIAQDIMVHPSWSGYRGLAQQAGLRACWSEPIKSSSAKVLGTFAIYYREPNSPNQADLDFIQDSARLAGIAIESKQGEEKIRASEKELTAILDSIQDIYYRTNLKGQILRISPSAQQTLGYKLEDMLNTQITNYWASPDERQRLLEALQAGGGKVQDFETTARRKDGSIIWVSANSHFFLDEKGNVSGVEGLRVETP